MLKKIAALLLSAMFTISAIPCVSAAIPKEDMEAALKGIQILPEKLSSKVTYDEFLNILKNFKLDDSSLMSAEEYARSNGMIAYGTKYTGTEKITVEDAVKFIVIALGYNIMIESGAEEDYMSAAAQIGLTRGISLAADDMLTSSEMIELLCNLMEAEPLTAALSTDSAYEVASGENLLSLSRDIYIYEGIVTANNNTSIYGTGSVTDGYIEISGDVFFIEYEYDQRLLGKKVVAFIQENRNGDNEILYVGERSDKNTIMQLEADEIEDVLLNEKAIKYCLENNSKEKSAKFSSAVKVIYNGAFYGSYTKEDLMPEQGGLELIDNNGDDVYDVIKVTDFEIMIADSVDAIRKQVTNQYNYEGCLAVLELEDIYEDGRLTVYKDGEEISFSAIAVGDVLNVALSKNAADCICEIYVSSERIQTQISSLDNDEGLAVIEAEEYSLAKDFQKYLTFGGKTVELGKEYVFYIDYFGKIAFYKAVTSSDYVLFHRVYCNDTMDKYFVRYMNIDGEWKESPLANKLKYDGGNYKAEAVYLMLKDAPVQVIRLKENPEGEVKQIIMATETSEYIEDAFTKTPSAKYTYRSNIKTFDHKLFITDSTKIFVMPSEYTNDRAKYYVISAAGYFDGDSSYTLSAYDQDSFGYTDLLSIVDDDTLTDARMGRGLFLVTGKRQAINDDNDILVVLEGSGSGLKDISYYMEDDSVAASIEAGDVINFIMDRRGMISDVRKVTNIKNSFSVSGLSDYYVSYGLINGIISDIDHERGRVQLDCGRKITFPLNTTVPCLEYDKNTNYTELLATRDLIKGDKLVCRLSWGALAEIIRVAE
ncbi:MAG: hypothetical protein J6N52_03865 [Clostridia bacterium]|nr:hypothetical protein [Clostridia bacterium]